MANENVVSALGKHGRYIINTDFLCLIRTN